MIQQLIHKDRWLFSFQNESALLNDSVELRNESLNDRQYLQKTQLVILYYLN